MNNYENITELLNSFSKFGKNELSRKTFMNVSGYPHYENVVSNILAFLFDSKEEHGMNNLWLKALFTSINVNVSDDDLTNATVEREVGTENNKRIDLLIKTNKHIVCIENKIFADLYNDLEEYKRTTDSINGENKLIPHYIVLSPKDLSSQIKCKSFVSLKYSQLFEEVKKILGNYISSCDSVWLLHTKEFISTIENITAERKTNVEFEKFYKQEFETICDLKDTKENYLKSIPQSDNELKQQTEIIESLLNYVKDYLDCIAQETRVLKEVLENTIKSKESGLIAGINQIEIKTYKPNFGCRASVYVDINNSELSKTITLETSRDPWGWYISLYNRYNAKKDIETLITTDLPSIKHDNSIVQKKFYEGHEIIYKIENTKDYNEIAKIIIDKIQFVLNKIK